MQHLFWAQAQQPGLTMLQRLQQVQERFCTLQQMQMERFYQPVHFKLLVLQVPQMQQLLMEKVLRVSFKQFLVALLVFLRAQQVTLQPQQFPLQQQLQVYQPRLFTL
jgi:hypothetical protein